MVHEVANFGGIGPVAHATGRILAEWGDKVTCTIAAGAGLAPWFCWSERAVGTNGMGTALETQNPVVIRVRDTGARPFTTGLAWPWRCATW